ncbi:glutathione-S-transferase [Wolfiporia cocos MD-104 SS10]|uniref:Glutathione-S-transferase n=1 Tax=Wolfiporia cocos (strain MD-104) TaxID=742152 RepID=A0A2H3J734_WOLCO|nr:glutathione-S-transferase [Wolfiporia cocos MD-104 SS10]
MGHENIHPVATGPAAETVAQHQDPQDRVLYAGWFCPFSQRAWITLEEKKISYQYKEVNPYNKERDLHFLDINPKGLVPAIEYKGRALYESLILCEFLEDAYPDHTPHLLPKDPFERAYVRLWIDHVSKAIIPAFYRTVQAQEPEKQQTGLQEFCKALRTISEKAKGPYFLGEQFSFVDVAIAPWAVRDYIVKEHRGYIRAAVGGGWKEWAEQLEKRESVIKTFSLPEHYRTFYATYLRGEAQGEIAKAIRSGRGSSGI